MAFVRRIARGLSNVFGSEALASGVAAGQEVVDGVNSGLNGIHSILQGPTPPVPGQLGPTISSFGTIFDSAVGGAASAVGSNVARKLGPSMSRQGKDARSYLQSAFPELNQWEQAGAGASGVGQAGAGAVLQAGTAAAQMDTQKKIAGINAVTSRLNTKDQVYAQNGMLRYNQRKAEAEIAQIFMNTKLTDEQRKHEIAKVLNTHSSTAKNVAQTAQIPFATMLMLKQMGMIDENIKTAQVERGITESVGTDLIDSQVKLNDAKVGDIKSNAEYREGVLKQAAQIDKYLRENPSIDNDERAQILLDFLGNLQSFK